MHSIYVALYSTNTTCITLFQDVITYLSVGFDCFSSVRNCKCNATVKLPQCSRTATKTQTPTENQMGQFHTSTDLPAGVGTRDGYDAVSVPDGVWVLCQREKFKGSYRIKIYQRKLRGNIWQHCWKCSILLCVGEMWPLTEKLGNKRRAAGSNYLTISSEYKRVKGEILQEMWEVWEEMDVTSWAIRK